MSEYYFDTNGELKHAGIKGMKWGVRRYQNADGSLTPAGKKRYAKIDRRIDRFETTRKQNKLEYDNWNREAGSRLSKPKQAKRLASVLARNKADYDITETTNKWLIARQKAKKDNAYKNSSEYKATKSEYGKQQADMYLYGVQGKRRIEQLKNLGKSETQAKAQTVAEQVLAGIGAVAVGAATGYAISKIVG